MGEVDEVSRDFYYIDGKSQSFATSNTKLLHFTKDSRSFFESAKVYILPKIYNIKGSHSYRILLGIILSKEEKVVNSFLQSGEGGRLIKY